MAHDVGGNAAEPATNVGAWLRALLIGSTDERNDLAKRLSAGPPWNPDEPAVVEELANELIPMFFVSGWTSEAEDFLSDIRLRGELSEARAEVLDEVVKIALGLEPSTIVDDVPKRAMIVRSILIGAIGRDLHLRRADAGAVVARAEQRAFSRGFHPARITV
jgi:hypothetical protein